MKLIATTIFFTLMLVACDGDSENDDSLPEEITEETIVEEEIFELEEPEEIIELSSEQKEQLQIRLNDSLSKVYEEMEVKYNLLKNIFEKEKQDLYKFERSSYSVYHGETQIWYFDESFNLLYFESEMGGEGGYEEWLFWVFDDSKLLFAFERESDGGGPSTSLESYDEKKISAVRYYTTYGSDRIYSIHSISPRENLYERFVKTISRNDFTFEGTFNYEESEEVESEYGGTESEGFNLKVDSALFENLYHQ